MDEHFFRHESGRLVVRLTRFFGTHHLALIEDVVQDTLVKAWEVWRFRGLPENPSAWLFRVARNKALDVLRRKKREQPLSWEHLEAFETEEHEREVLAHPLLADDVLRMMFVCCHPSLPQESQIALMLKYLCGFSVQEIARAFLTTEANIEKRLYRARQTFRKQHIPFEVPTQGALPARFSQVLLAIYLLFNEGYKSNQLHEVIRQELMEEALRLGVLLTEQPQTRQPEAFALLALMCFQAARTHARLTETGALCLLPDQNRCLWNGPLIEIGKTYLNKAATGTHLSRYHLEAGISWEHTRAATYQATNWGKILQYYDALETIAPSPIASLNRLIALAEVEGPRVALAAFDHLPHRDALSTHHLYFSIRAYLLSAAGEREKALLAWEQALEKAPSEAERLLIQHKINALI